MEPAEDEVLVVRNTFLHFSRPALRLRRTKSWSPGYSSADEPYTPGGSCLLPAAQQDGIQLSAHVSEAENETLGEWCRTSGSPHTPQEQFADYQSFCSGDGEVGASLYPVTGYPNTPHELGTCSPCKFFFTKGCKKDDCEFCHLSHPKKKRPRPSKDARRQCKEMHRMLEEAQITAEEKAQIVAELAGRNEYFRRLVQWAPENVSTRLSTWASSDDGAVSAKADKFGIGGETWTCSSTISTCDEDFDIDVMA